MCNDAESAAYYIGPWTIKSHAETNLISHHLHLILPETDDKFEWNTDQNFTTPGENSEEKCFFNSAAAVCVARSRKMFIKMRDATKHAFNTALLKSQKYTIGFRICRVCATGVRSRGPHWFSTSAHRPDSLHLKASLKILHVHTYVHITDAAGLRTCAREDSLSRQLHLRTRWWSVFLSSAHRQLVSQHTR